MTFDEAFQKFTEAFPDQYISLTYIRTPYTYLIKGYAEGKGYSADCKSIGEVIMQLNKEDAMPETTGPELEEANA